MKKSISQAPPLPEKPVLVVKDPRHRFDIENLDKLDSLVNGVIENSKNVSL